MLNDVINERWDIFAPPIKRSKKPKVAIKNAVLKSGWNRIIKRTI